MATEKLYVNRVEGFAGTGLKKDELVCDCSPLDDIIVIREDGNMLISKVSEKAFVGKDIVHIGVFQRNDERTVYNLIYQDGPRGNVMKKRFAVSGVTRDKVYDLTRGNKGSKVLYLTCNPNGEAEVVTILLKPMPNLKKLQFDVDFSELAVKNRASQGNIVTQYPVKKIVLKERGLSTLGALMIWYDDSVQRLNVDQRGTYLGEFAADDRILAVSQQGTYRLHTFDLNNHFDEDLVLIEKFNPDRPITAVYFDGERKEFFVKRFLAEPSDKKVLFISEIPGSYLEMATTQQDPVVDVEFAKQKGKAADPESVLLAEIIAVKGLKARGNRLSAYKVKAVNLRPQPEEQGEPFYEKEGNPVELDLTRIRAIQANLDDMEQQMSLDL
jgi:topoisomerase-4 subunit A